MASKLAKNLKEQVHFQNSRGVESEDSSSSVVGGSSSVDQFCKNFKVQVNRLTKEDIEFDLIGCDASLANAFRRILIAEVPTMAIDKVFIANNTSVIPDEVLAHRIGLIPILADPRLFDFLSENDSPNENNTIVFKLHIKCMKSKLADGLNHLTVYAQHLEWLPKGSEFGATSFKCEQSSLLKFPDNEVELVDPKIIIAKLALGQEIELEAHAVKGIGKTHAKWSPVATAWYRALPEIELLKPFEDEEADELVKRFPESNNIFNIEETANGTRRAVVARPRKCTLHSSDLGDSVAVRSVKDHFIFTIESVRQYPPEDLLTEAVKVLEKKCESIISGTARQPSPNDAAPAPALGRNKPRMQKKKALVLE